METVLRESATPPHEADRKPDRRLSRLYSSIIAVVLGGLVWVAFNSIAIYQIDWEGLPPTVSIPLVVSLVGSIIFVVGIILSLLLVSRVVQGLQA